MCLKEVTITMEEAEAIRLKDIETLEQEQCAEKMNISRQTFQRIMVSVRRKIADALLTGKAIRIEGGHFEVSPVRLGCSNGHEWEVQFESLTNAPPQSCPVCKTESIKLLTQTGFGCPCRGKSPRCERCPRIAGVDSKFIGSMVSV